MKWYEPDTRWDLYVKSKEDFIDKFVVEGKFHKNVPKDIVDSFETVTYLLAHSYYHWPMFDEALSKATLIMELAVKLKAKELNITLEKTSKNNKVYKKRLFEIIKEVFSIDYLKFLYPDFDRARNLRNLKMHPESHSFMGAMSFAYANAHLFVNIINLLFSDKLILENITSKRVILEMQLSVFKNNLFVLEYDNTKILIVDVHSLKYVENTSKQLLLLYINPIFTNVNEVFVKKKYPEPLIITLTTYSITGVELKGKDLNGEPIKMYQTNKPENLEKWYKYGLDIKKVHQKDIDTYIQFNASPALWEMERIIYENW